MIGWLFGLNASNDAALKAASKVAKNIRLMEEILTVRRNLTMTPPRITCVKWTPWDALVSDIKSGKHLRHVDAPTPYPPIWNLSDALIRDLMKPFTFRTRDLTAAEHVPTWRMWNECMRMIKQGAMRLHHVRMARRPNPLTNRLYIKLNIELPDILMNVLESIKHIQKIKAN